MSNTVDEVEAIKSNIHTIRGVKVMLDRDLARLYGVTTGNLNKAVSRNTERFPSDFMFRLSKDEYDFLRFQFGTLKQGAHSKYLPYVFTEQGVAMLSGILKSKIAVEINIRIMRAFVKIRELIASDQRTKVLEETVKAIKAEIDEIKFVDHKLFSEKITKLSNKVNEISESVDEFNNNHIVIKRPEKGLNEG